MLLGCANRNTHIHKRAQPPPNKTINLARRWELPYPDLIYWPHLRDSSDKIILRCLFLCCCVLPPSYKAACPCQAHLACPTLLLPCHASHLPQGYSQGTMASGGSSRRQKTLSDHLLPIPAEPHVTLESLAQIKGSPFCLISHCVG